MNTHAPKTSEGAQALMGSGWDDNGEPDLEPRLTEAERADLDQRWRTDLTDAYDDIIRVVRAAIKTKRKVRITDPCPNPKCNCQHVRWVEIEDVKAAIDAAEFLSNRALGRPSQASSEEDSERIVFQRLVEFPAE